MAPTRTIPKSLKKKSSKRPPTDFTSLGSALRSAPDLDAEGWLEVGVQQEENGERYQAGEKARRHYRNSILCYQAALSLCRPSVPGDVSSAFDGHYNRSRVLQILATEHVAAPECCQMLEESIGGFKTALEMGIEDVDGERIIDCLFNLGCALTTLQGMILEGAIEGVESEVGIRLGWEAKTVLSECETMQREQLERVVNGQTEGGGEVEMVDGDTNGETSIPEDPEEKKKSLLASIVDTVHESITNDLVLFTHLQATLPSSPLLSAIAQDTPSHLSSLSSLVLLHSPTLPIELSLVSLELLTLFDLPSSSFSPPLSFAKLATLDPNNVDVLSSWADDIIDNLPSSDPLAYKQRIEHALALYEKAFTLLSNRLRPPPKLPLHSLPALVAANLAARATTTLLAWQIFSTSAALVESTQFTLERAQELALLAIELSGIAIKLTLDSRGSWVKIKLAGEERRDWKTVRAFREALMTLVRVRMRIPGINLDAERETLSGIWKEATGREWGFEVQLWVKEILGDPCWEAGKGRADEEACWKTLRG